MNFQISSPRYRDSTLATHTLEQTDEGRYADSTVEVALDIQYDGSDCVWIRHAWRCLEEEIEIQPVIEVVDRFVCTDYVIPCVSVHGNQWGSGKEPKGLTLNGKPWVFDARRTGIPGCTLTENAEHYCALLAWNDCHQSLTVSCSLERMEGGHMAHRLIYPTIEEPLTYCGRDKYCAPLQTFVHLTFGQRFSATACLLFGKPTREHFAMINVQNFAMRFLDDDRSCQISRDDLWRLSIQFAEKLLYPYAGTRFFIIGYLLKQQGAELREDFEFGWCGQNGRLARMLLIDYRETGERARLEAALGCLDAWARALHPNSGIPWVRYEECGRENAASDTCNLSFYISEMLKCYLLTKDMGISRPTYLSAALSTANFLVEHRSEVFGFGKLWRVETGECLDPDGTIGVYPVHSLIEVYAYTGDRRYLEAAQKAYLFYVQRDLLKFECTAGALDTHCIDKETSGAMILGGIALYEATEDQKYLEYAALSAEYFCSWMYYYDVPCGEHSDFVRFGYRTMGASSVSVQHHHVDPWGVLMVPSLYKLARYTGDFKWRVRARMLWFGGTQLVTIKDGEEVHKGLKRPAGSQNEAYLQCRWGWGCDAVEPGAINDWLVAWPAAFRLHTLWELSSLEE